MKIVIMSHLVGGGSGGDGVGWIGGRSMIGCEESDVCRGWEAAREKRSFTERKGLVQL